VVNVVTTSRFVNNEKIDPAILGKIMGPEITSRSLSRASGLAMTEKKLALSLRGAIVTKQSQRKIHQDLPG